VRVFSALPLPAPTIDHIVSSFSPTRQLYPRLRWVGAQGLHVTLHFFGEIPDASVETVKQALDHPSLRRPPIRARLGKVGRFPPGGSPRVIWVGIGQGEDEMRAYWKVFEERIAPLGYVADARGFNAHITVARAGSLALEDGWGSRINVPAEEFLVRECVLFQSILGRDGAVYVPLKRIAFQEGGE
jgi:RNA 2',3'-cyclic 3'-phosphodiesterase